MPQLDILYYQIKSPVLGGGYIVLCNTIDSIPEMPQTIKRALLTLHNLMVGSYCRKHHLLMALNMEKPS